MAEEASDVVRHLLAELAARMPVSDAELRYRLEPLRADRKRAVAVLIDLLREDDRAPRLVAAALHELATAEDAGALVAAFRDPRGSERARADVAQILAGVAADRLEALLEPQEIHELSLLSIDTLLDRLCDRSGMAQVVELYRGSSPNERRALLDAIAEATNRPSARIRLGAALDPLFPEEPDKPLRAAMIRRVADRSEPASARALGRWLGRVHGQERRRVLEALRRLEHLGMRRGARSLEAWVSGVDATGSFNVGISFPGPLELRDILLACISVDAGLRAVNVITAVGADTAGEIGRALEEGQAIPIAPLDVAAALRHIEAARRRTMELGRTLPDGFAAAAPYLRRPLAVARAADPASEISSLPTAAHAGLLDVPAYASWLFGHAELPLPRSFTTDEPLSSRRLRVAVRATLRSLDGTPAAARLVAMLRHQSEVHRLRSESTLAARSLAAAREIAERGLAASAFARRLVERSVLATLVRGPKTLRADVRDVFKRRIEQSSALRRRAVAVLDLAEVFYRQLENFNERRAPSDRLALAQMEAMSLGAATMCAAELSRDATEQPRLPGMEGPQRTSTTVVRGRIRAEATRLGLEAAIGRDIVANTGLLEEAALRLAAALVSAGRWFADEVCLRRCRRACLLEPEADGRALFFDPHHPAGLDFAPGDDAPVRSAGALALRHHLARHLEDQIDSAASFAAAVESLDLPARGADRARRRRAADRLDRLRTLRQELERTEEDPAWLYALVEETEEVARELSMLHRMVLGSSVARLSPAPEQFAGFEAYPEAHGVWRRFERLLRRLGLIGLPLRSLQAVADRCADARPLTALLAGAADRSSRHLLHRLGENAVEFWNHTPRSALAARTPAQAEGRAP
ncbi:MAG: hypothetical protein ABW298_09490 [Candidatus Binatia bacterium]